MGETKDQVMDLIHNVGSGPGLAFSDKGYFTSDFVDASTVKALGEFADPSKFTDPIACGGFEQGTLKEKLEMMILIRKVEEGVASLVQGGHVKCPCHLGIGQEAVAVGVSTQLNSRDRVFGGHRSHAHYLALGAGVNELFAEILGKVTGCSRGMGGSMHLTAPDHGFVGSVPIVGATIPIAVGAALALKMDGDNHIAVSYFGDGASEEGVFHESLNLAACYKLPILFVCENNLYSSHLDINLRQPGDNVSRFALSHHMPSIVVDGNHVIAVEEATRRLSEFIRNGHGPAFLEAVTYRWKGHVGPNEDIDVGVRRKPGDLVAWKHRDPIRRLFEGMKHAEIIDDHEYWKLTENVEKKVALAMECALSAPYPDEEQLMSCVYFSA